MPERSRRRPSGPAGDDAGVAPRRPRATAVLQELGLSTAAASTDFRIAGASGAGHCSPTWPRPPPCAARSRRRSAATNRARSSSRAPRRPCSSPPAPARRDRRRLRRAGGLEPPGPGTGLIHAIERRALGRVRLLLPTGVEPSAEANALGLDKPMVALLVAIGVTWSTWESRARTAVCTGGTREEGARPGGRRLRGRGSGGVAPSGDRHRSGGRAPPSRPPRRSRAPRPRMDRRRSSRPVCRAPRLGGGVRVRIAPRGLTGSLSSRRSAPASRRDPALPRPLSRARARALARPAARRARPLRTVARGRSRGGGRPHRRRARRYAERARELLRPHSHEELRRRVKEQVLPVLLGLEAVTKARRIFELRQ